MNCGGCLFCLYKYSILNARQIFDAYVKEHDAATKDVGVELFELIGIYRGDLEVSVEYRKEKQTIKYCIGV